MLEASQRLDPIQIELLERFLRCAERDQARPDRSTGAGVNGVDYAVEDDDIHVTGSIGGE